MKSRIRPKDKPRVPKSRFFRPRGEQLEPRTLLASIVVNDLGDGEDYDVDDGVCSATFHLEGPPDDPIRVPNNDCTLKAAANHADVSSGLDTVTFGFPAGTVIATNAIGFGEPVKIDGGAGKIVLTSLAGPGGSGLYVRGGSGSEVRNLVLTGFGDGLQIGSDVLVAGCHIGVNLAGTAAAPNTVGIRSGGSNNVIGGVTAADRNIISGNTDVGVLLGTFVNLGTDPSNNLIIGNYIGTDVTGTVAIGNGLAKTGNAGQGIRIGSGSGNIIGGVGAAGNIISNNRIGILIDAAANANYVVGNKIGTDITGTVRMGNIEGLEIFGPNNVIGGDLPGGAVEIVGNIISGSVGDAPGGIFGAGVHLIDFRATGNLIQGNKIGTDITGTIKIPNKSDGVDINAGASGNTVGGLTAAARNIISGNDGDGVTIFSNQTGSNNNFVQGNYIGVDVTGLVALGNKFRGVHIDSNATGNLIGGDTPAARNIISGNLSDGVIIALAGATNNKITGNYIGLGTDGITDLGNTRNGVFILEAEKNEIGGTQVGQGNVISGNALSGVRIQGTSSSANKLLGNLIGPLANGVTELGNDESGLIIANAPMNVIGERAAAPTSRNVISSNAQRGVYIFGASSTGNHVTGNFIGTTASGMLPLGNTTSGVYIEDAADNIVGVDLFNPSSGNTISANSFGVLITGPLATGNIVAGNFIGTDLEGTPGPNPGMFPLGNSLSGVAIDGAADNFIGPQLIASSGCDTETTPSQFNVISGNLFSGVEIVGDSATGNVIRCNSIFGNAGLGIDLNDDGVSTNDMLDEDASPNELQNFPVISLIDQFEGTILVGGTLHSKASTTYRIDFYATDVSDATELEHGLQGKRYLGTKSVTTDSTGYIHFEADLPELVDNEVITATATDQLGNTSEFSPFTQDVNGSGAFEARTPVLVIPGIFGSFPLDAPGFAGDDGNYSNWLLTVGTLPTLLKLDPLIHVYDDLITTLERAGYEQDKDLFAAAYDWRLNLAPIDPDQDTHDGTITGVTGASLTDSKYDYGLDYLGFWLKKAAESWFTRYGQPLANVHVIAHSMGGLLTRAYIQSTAYGDKFASAAAGRDLPLPVVSNFTMLGVPHQGGVGTWNGWHDNFVADLSSRLVLSKVINHAWHKLTENGEVITVGSEGRITADILDGRTEQEAKIEFIRRYSPGLGNLLPNFNGFAENFDPALYPAAKNLLLKDLNSDYSFADRVARSTAIYGTSPESDTLGINTKTAARVKQHVGGFFDPDDVILSFTDYEADDSTNGEIYWEDILIDAHGDGTVAIESLEGPFIGDDRVELVPYCQSSCRAGDQPSSTHVGHLPIVTNVDAQVRMLQILGHPLSPGQVSKGNVTGGEDLLYPFATYNFINDPVKSAFLVDASGRRLGYSQATGQLTEIPGSFYFGNEDGIGWIFSNTAIRVHLELVGAGQDHYVQASGFGTVEGFGVESTGMFPLDESRELEVTPTYPFPWHNVGQPVDVTGGLFNQPDGNIVAGDVLAIINYINASQSGPIPPNAFLGLPFGFLDTTQDNNVAADDVLRVINAINAGQGGAGASTSLTAAVSLAADSAQADEFGASTSVTAAVSLPTTNSALMESAIAELIDLLALETVSQNPRRRRR